MSRITHDPRLRFLIALACWSVALLAILRSPWGQRALVAPFTAWHAAFASGYAGGSPVTVDLSCSGSEVIALSIAAVLAYPVAWRRRLSGVAIGSAWLAGLNLLRVISLTNTVGSSLFVPLHTYIWPALMIGGSVAFVIGWVFIGQQPGLPAPVDRARERRFVAATTVLLIAYVASAPKLLASDALITAALGLASAAAVILRFAGVDALVGGSTLVVGQQAFLVTPECILTPLMPVYLAWAATWPRTMLSRIVAVALFAPVFACLGGVRLLTVALPGVIGPPLFLTHGFYQFVVALLLVAVTAHWRARQTQSRWTMRYVVYGVLTAGTVAIVFGRPYTWTVDWATRVLWERPPQTWFVLAPDVQGATAIMPAFQLSLLCALCVALLGSRAIPFLAVLVPAGAVVQVATLLVIRELAGRLGAEAPVTAVRAMSLLIPAALALMAAAIDRRSALQDHPIVDSRR